LTVTAPRTLRDRRGARALPRAGAWLLRLGLGLAAVQAGAEEPERGLRQVIYDYAVTSYCGLLTAEVEYGFQRELKALSEASALSEAEAKAERIAGWVDADREWSNRGLGGNRAWCREDGIAAAERFLAYAARP
jgi:hypothetical protein